MKNKKLELWNIILKHRFQWNFTDPNYKKKNISNVTLAMISASTPSTIKAFNVQVSLDSYIFRLVTFINLDKLFCLLQNEFMYTTKQSFFHLSNTIIIYNGNGMNITIFEHNSSLQTCCSMYFKHVSSCFERISRLWNIN